MSLRGLEGGSNILAAYTIHDIDETDGTYNYYGFLRADGRSIILRINKAATQYRYAVGTNYLSDWTNKATKDYNIIAS